VAVELVLLAESVARTEGLIRAAVAAVDGAGLPVFVLTDRASPIVPKLEAAGFDLQGEYISLLRRTAKPIALPKMVPAIAKNAVGV
jgi:hypothetical protein